MPKSFVKKNSPNKPRFRAVLWPMPQEEGEEPLKVKVWFVGGQVIEQAHFAAEDFFKAEGRKLDRASPVFELRERAEIVMRAVTELEAEKPGDRPVAEDVDELLAEGGDNLVNALFVEWSRFQGAWSSKPLTEAQVQEVIDDAKKGGPLDRLVAWPTSWLIALSSTLASRLASSTKGDSSG